MKHLVILGGGYGGMGILARLLSNNLLPNDVTITLIDRLTYHSLKLKYYELAAGTITFQDVCFAFPEHPKLKIINSEIERISLAEKKVYMTDAEPVYYDDLIIGLGCEDNFHNVPGAKEFSCSLQTIEKASRTYQKLHKLTPGSVVSIVGAGLSGVELASELTESRRDLKIKLFDRGTYILSSFPERLSTYVENWFDNHGVEIVNHANITRVEENLLYNHDEPLESDAIIWTAGIQANRIVREMGVEKNKQGRITLTKYHNIPNYENAYVVGDCACLPHAPSAQLAEGQAEQIVQVLLKRWNGGELPETMPPIKLKGMLGSLGKKQGFGILAEKPVTGRVARLLKSGVLWMYKYHKG